MDDTEKQMLTMPAELHMRITLPDGRALSLPATLKVDPSTDPPTGRIVGRVVEPFMLNAPAAVSIIDAYSCVLMTALIGVVGKQFNVHDTLTIGVKMLTEA